MLRRNILLWKFKPVLELMEIGIVCHGFYAPLPYHSSPHFSRLSITVAELVQRFDLSSRCLDAWLSHYCHGVP